MLPFTLFLTVHRYYTLWPPNPKILCMPLLSPRKKMTMATSSVMITLLWVQITGLPLRGPLLTVNIPAANGTTTPLPPESSELKRKSKFALGQTFFYSSFHFYFRGPGRQKLWHKGKGKHIWWCNQKILQRLDGPVKQRLTQSLAVIAFKGCDLCSLRRRVLQRDLRRCLQPLNWDTVCFFCVFFSNIISVYITCHKWHV